MENSIMVRIGAIFFLILAGCTAPSAANFTFQGTPSSQEAKYIQAQVDVTISQNGTTIYSDSNPSGSLVLNAGQTYNFDLTVTNAPAGTSYSLVMTNVDQLTETPITVPLVSGDNSFTVPNAGNYTWQLELTATGYSMQTKNYTADVTCPSPTFTANSLTSSAITVTAGTGSNLYNFSAVGVAADANGTPPYVCAWDFTGVGIVDSGFADCNTVLNNQYVNYVATRNIGVIVMDACNTAYSISNPQALNYTEPALGAGNVFIFGQTSGATGNAATDPRSNNVTYLATNSGGNNIVIPHYGSGSFTIEAFDKYGMPSSVNFGVEIQLQGFTDTIQDSSSGGMTPNMTPTIDTSGVTIKSVTYVTDQAGDQVPSVTFSSSSCTLTNLNATALYVAGQPCATGTTGDQNGTTVEVWGHYSCSMVSGSGTTMTFAGDFDGLDKLADSCSGGGQGGGGIVPISL